MDYIVLLLQLVAAFMIMFGLYNRKLVFSGVIWGIKVSPSKAQTCFRIRNTVSFAIGLVLFIVMLFPTFEVLITMLFKSFFTVIIFIVLWLATFMVAAYIAKFINDKRLKSGRESNALVLENLPFIQAVEAQLDEAKAFVVSFEGIALVNAQNYCYCIERYENYKYGELTTPQEVALIGLYFVQKHSDKFDYSIESEIIPGAPGQVYMIWGSSGVKVTYKNGTLPEAIFKSYIFTRK